MGTTAKMCAPKIPFLRPNRKNVARATFKNGSKNCVFRIINFSKKVSPKNVCYEWRNSHRICGEDRKPQHYRRKAKLTLNDLLITICYSFNEQATILAEMGSNNSTDADQLNQTTV